MIGFSKYEGRGDYATAARYLQLPPGQNTDVAQLGKEIVALRRRFSGNIELLSDDPEGTVEPGLPPDHERAGVIEVGGTATDFVLVRVDDPASGKIWLVSKETVASIPQLYAEMESEAPTTTDRIATFILSGRRLFGMYLRQWLGWLLSIPIAWVLAWLLDFC